MRSRCEGVRVEEGEEGGEEEDARAVRMPKPAARAAALWHPAPCDRQYVVECRQDSFAPLFDARLTCRDGAHRYWAVR